MKELPQEIFFNQDNLRSIIENSYDGIMVTDNKGIVLLANPASARYMGHNPDEIIGKSVRDLMKRGTYNRSTTLEALEKRTVVTGLVKTTCSGNIMSTSIPLFDDQGELIMVLTNSRSKDLIDTYIAAIEQERDNADRYKNAAAYLAQIGYHDKDPVAESAKMKQVLLTAGKIAKADSTVLILGESGTGKEVMSRYIHQHSAREKEPFIPVNCAAIPHELMESEFFGYEKGAFSGASSRGKPGLFELADKGTLFLDELAELPLMMQSKLLRVLETGEVQRLGATALRRTNVRLIAATNKDLKQMVAGKTFREDLYYRLNVIPLMLPPLRDRPEDIRALAQQFLEGLNRKYQTRKFLSAKTIRLFQRYDWPGNVRELRNVIERLVITSPNDELDFDDEASGNQGAIQDVVAQLKPKMEYHGELKQVLREVEKQYISQVLHECGGRMTEAARKLGIHRTMLYRKIEKSNKSEDNNENVD